MTKFENPKKGEVAGVVPQEGEGFKKKKFDINKGTGFDLKGLEAEPGNKLITGVDPEEYNRVFVGDLVELKADPKRWAKMSSRFVEHLARAMKEDAGKKAKEVKSPASYEAEFVNMELNNSAGLFARITLKKFSSDDAEFKAFEKEIQKISAKYILLSPKAQLEIAIKLKEKWNFSGDAELLRKMILINIKRFGDLKYMKMAVKDPKFMAEYQKLIESGVDPEEAFEKAMKKSSLKLQKSFEKYSKQWQSSNVSDVFSENVVTVAGVKVEVPAGDDVKAAVAAYQQEGVRIDIPADSHVGMVHIGSGIVREVAMYYVNGSPKLFVYDGNADKGVRGPIDSAKAKEAFFEMSIDDYFSKKFREFATFDSEKDPTKVADNKLLKVAHAFFPDSALNKIALDAGTRQLLDNFAYLCVTPDERYLSMNKKIDLFDLIANDPLTSYDAKKILSERNFVKTKGTLSVFEEELKVKRPQFLGSN
ncbi:MAG: hypothetical protein Q8P62_05590 [Candidatus Peregrinibacteria bacterium]|nr:hypothetical protein [Candidatus Peregrinibacteria bacterium]